jgi:uncharacterized protein (DUF433 family)
MFCINIESSGNRLEQAHDKRLKRKQKIRQMNYSDYFVPLLKILKMKDYKDIITIEPGKRGGKPCIRGMRITVNDILGWLASGMSIQEILADYDELVEEDIYAALSFAADRENKIYQVAV